MPGTTSGSASLTSSYKHYRCSPHLHRSNFAGVLLLVPSRNFHFLARRTGIMVGCLIWIEINLWSAKSTLNLGPIFNSDSYFHGTMASLALRLSASAWNVAFFIFWNGGNLSWQVQKILVLKPESLCSECNFIQPNSHILSLWFLNTTLLRVIWVLISPVMKNHLRLLAAFGLFVSTLGNDDAQEPSVTVTHTYDVFVERDQLEYDIFFS